MGSGVPSVCFKNREHLCETQKLHKIQIVREDSVDFIKPNAKNVYVKPKINTKLCENEKKRSRREKTMRIELTHQLTTRKLWKSNWQLGLAI